MASGRYVRNPSGYRAVLVGPESQEVCGGAAASGAATANAIAGAHGSYVSVYRGGAYRVHYRVTTPPGDYVARNSEAKNGVLRRLSIGL